MRETIKLVVSYAFGLLLIPHLFLLALSKNKHLLSQDIRFWAYRLDINHRTIVTFLYLMKWYPEFRNIFYFRVRGARFFSFLVRPLPLLTVSCPKVAGGLFIQHGYSTIVSARSIGENCIICQQVTVGYTSNGRSPVIGNNVKICAGAIIVGDVTIGDNAIIGAGAIVVDDVPSKAVVCSPKATVVKYENSI